MHYKMREKKVIVKFIGGLGNQMFQYATGCALAKKHGVRLLLDISPFQEYKLHKYSLGHYNIIENFATMSDTAPFLNVKNRNLMKYLPFLTNNKIVTEKIFEYNPLVNKYGNVYLDGFWQTEKYFQDIAELIRQEFTVKNSPQGEDLRLINEMADCNAVSLHVRRTDYVTNKSALAIHGVCDLDYYREAIELMVSKIDNPVFYIFSDDHQWVRENMKLDYKTIFVTHNNADTNYEDLRLMSSCKHNILANSSFSWWGAWLNSNPNKIVIGPKRWFTDPNKNVKDLLPANWIAIGEAQPLTSPFKRLVKNILIKLNNSSKIIGAFIVQLLNLISPRLAELAGVRYAEFRRVVNKIFKNW